MINIIAATNLPIFTKRFCMNRICKVVYSIFQSIQSRAATAGTCDPFIKSRRKHSCCACGCSDDLDIIIGIRVGVGISSCCIIDSSEINHITLNARERWGFISPALACYPCAIRKRISVCSVIFSTFNSDL